MSSTVAIFMHGWAAFTGFLLFPMVVWSFQSLEVRPPFYIEEKSDFTFEGYVFFTMWKKAWFSILQCGNVWYGGKRQVGGKLKTSGLLFCWL